MLVFVNKIVYFISIVYGYGIFIIIFEVEYGRFLFLIFFRSVNEFKFVIFRNNYVCSFVL